MVRSISVAIKEIGATLPPFQDMRKRKRRFGLTARVVLLEIRRIPYGRIGRPSSSSSSKLETEISGLRIIEFRARIAALIVEYCTAMM